MKSSEFIIKAKELVKKYANEHLDKSDGIPEFDVFVVWYAYELGHSKALLSTTLLDGMYYEITYNSNKNEIYFDAYKKFENKCINIENDIMKYKLKDGVSFNLINKKSIIKFDFDLSDYYNKETRIFEFPKGYVAFSLMSDVFNTFLFPLDLVEEIKDVKD